MTTPIRLTLASAALLALSATASHAQVMPFDAEVDCNGNFAPGDTVPWTIRLENQTLQSIPLNVSVSLSVPIVGTLDLINVDFTLGPNQDVIVPRMLGLPDRVPSGQYQFQIVATSAMATAFDTCSFDVF